MTLQVEIGQKLNNNQVQVNTFEVPQGTGNKYSPKAYAVSEDKKDEFIKDLKDKSKTTSKLTAFCLSIGAVLGAAIGWKYTTRADLKPWGALLSFMGGAVLGCAPAAIYDKICVNNIKEKYGVQRITYAKGNRL